VGDGEQLGGRGREKLELAKNNKCRGENVQPIGAFVYTHDEL